MGCSRKEQRRAETTHNRPFRPRIWYLSSTASEGRPSEVEEEASKPAVDAMGRADPEAYVAASKESAALRRPIPWSSAEMASPEGLDRIQTVSYTHLTLPTKA